MTEKTNLSNNPTKITITSHSCNIDDCSNRDDNEKDIIATIAVEVRWYCKISKKASKIIETQIFGKRTKK